MTDKKISQLAGATTPLTGTEIVPIVQSGVTKNVSVANLTAGRDVAVAGFSSFKSGVNVAVIESGSTAVAVSTKNNSRQWAVGTGYLSGGAEFDIVDLTASAGRVQIDISGNVKVSSGNLVIGTSGKGIDFSATGQAGGMTNELLSDYEEGTWTPVLTAGTGTLTSYSSSGAYTRVGRVVTLSGYMKINNNGTGSDYLLVSGLPFTIGSNGASGAVQESGVTGNLCAILAPNGGTSFQLWTYSNGYPGATNAVFQFSFSYFV